MQEAQIPSESAVPGRNLVILTTAGGRFVFLRESKHYR